MPNGDDGYPHRATYASLTEASEDAINVIEKQEKEIASLNKKVEKLQKENVTLKKTIKLVK